jgi:hypothetical protein
LWWDKLIGTGRFEGSTAMKGNTIHVIEDSFGEEVEMFDYWLLQSQLVIGLIELELVCFLAVADVDILYYVYRDEEDILYN